MNDDDNLLDDINEEDFFEEKDDIEEINEEDYDKEFKDISFGNDEVRQYFLTIANYDLLTKKEEEELYPIIEKRNKALEKLEQFENCEIDLSIAEELKYKKIIESSEWAREKLINHNLKLVVFITKKYYNFCHNLEILDVIQDGNMGLMKAVDKFDPSKGIKFCTYAYWWIRQAILRGIEANDKLIRLPVHMIESLNMYLGIKSKIFNEKGIEPSDEEMANLMNITLDKIEILKTYIAKPVCLSKKINNEEDDSSELMDMVEDKTIQNPFEYTKEQQLKVDINNVLTSLLDERESEIIKLRFGLKDGICHTLEEIGLIYNVTRERIRQIETKCLWRIKKSDKGKQLITYLRDGEEEI